jgi:hypothetical protein
LRSALGYSVQKRVVLGFAETKTLCHLSFPDILACDLDRQLRTQAAHARLVPTTVAARLDPIALRVARGLQCRSIIPDLAG